MRPLTLPPFVAACILLAGCTGEPDTPPLPLAWESAPALALEPARLLREQAIEGAVRPSRLRHEPRTALTFAIDPATDRVHVLDETYRHSARPRCIDPERVGELDEPAWRDDCQEGLVQVHRGFVRLSSPVDVALDSEGLAAWVVGASGLIARVELDLQAGNTLGWLRAGNLEQTELRPRSAAWDDGLWVSTPEAVVRLDEALEVVETIPMVSPELLHPFDATIVLAGDGLHLGEAEPIATSRAAAAGDFVAWWADDVLAWSDGVTVPFQGEPDAIALDPGTGTAWVVRSGEVLRVTRDGTETRLGVDADALVVTDTHDAVLVDDDTLRAFGDELALADAEGAPVAFTNIAFLETPRSFEDEIACDAPNVDGDIARGLRSSSFGRTMLATLPGAWAVGVTPRFAEGVLLCGQEERFAPWLAGPWELGLLMHQSTLCEDQDCYAAFMTERMGRLRALGAAPTWIGGGSEHGSRGLDPVQGALAVGLRRHLFFGLGLDPALDPEGPLWKEPWPAQPGEGGVVFFADRVDQLPAGASSGEMAFYPGNSVRGFALGACEGLLVRECTVLSAGSDRFDESDVASLKILARHAVARRGRGLTSWSWHLPDLTQFDYTEGCTVSEEGIWSTDGSFCQAELLQDLTWDLHQTLVQNGLATWSLPSALPTE